MAAVSISGSESVRQKNWPHCTHMVFWSFFKLNLSRLKGFRHKQEKPGEKSEEEKKIIGIPYSCLDLLGQWEKEDR
jgi:hypothetical protein